MGRQDAVHIFRRYRKVLVNTAFRMTASPAQSEEIMQETLIKYLTKKPALETDAQIAKWLKTTCVRMCIDYLRKQSRWVSLDSIADRGESIGGTESPPAEWGTEEEHDWDVLGEGSFEKVMNEIRALPEGYRSALVLKAIEGYEYSEIAEMMGITESTVRSQYMRARKRVYENVMKQSAGNGKIL